MKRMSQSERRERDKTMTQSETRKLEILIGKIETLQAQTKDLEAKERLQMAISQLIVALSHARS